MTGPLRTCVSAQDAAAQASGTAWQQKFDIATRRFVRNAHLADLPHLCLASHPSCSLHLSEPTARSLPDVVADKICCCRGLHMIRRTILLQNSHNRMQHCARRPPLADNLTTVAQGRLRGSFRRCWLRRRSVQQTALCACKRCSSERCALQNSCYALLTALCELGWLRARHTLANVFTADC
jgi:hypothetical protein